MSSLLEAKRLLNVAYQGAVEGGRAALTKAVLDRWSGEITQLDWEVSCSSASWWKKEVHRLLPPWLLRMSLFKQADLQPFRKDVGGGPAYGTRGNSKGQGLQCIDKEMAVNVGSPFFLPRMIRTSAGREMLLQRYLEQKEREADSVLEEDFCPAGAD